MSVSPITVTFSGKRRCYEMMVDNVPYQLFLAVITTERSRFMRPKRYAVIRENVQSKGNLVYAPLKNVRNEINEIVLRLHSSDTKGFRFTSTSNYVFSDGLAINGNPGFLDMIPYSSNDSDRLNAGRLTMRAPIPLWQAIVQDIRKLLDGVSWEDLPEKQPLPSTATPHLPAANVSPLAQQLQPRRRSSPSSSEQPT